MATQPKNFVTSEQYLEIERKAEFKSEYYDGQMFAMAGASLPHNRLLVNTVVALDRQIRGRGCEVFTNDLRVHVGPTGLYTYPDVIALCGEPQLADDHFDVLLNPGLIVEVLSPSTEAYDRGLKFEHYRRIESLRAYLLIAADRVHVDLYTRQLDREWVLSEASGLSETIDIRSLECKLALSAIYDRVDLA
ncbi:MAG: Uma2 family endonuclease [Acidobacteriota bacterium]|nr:Uma2 family endonuclease [Acidobacteriota bacterium]